MADAQKVQLHHTVARQLAKQGADNLERSYWRYLPPSYDKYMINIVKTNVGMELLGQLKTRSLGADF